MIFPFLLHIDVPHNRQRNNGSGVNFFSFLASSTLLMHHCDRLRPEKTCLRKRNPDIIVLPCICIGGIIFYYSFRTFIRYLMPMCVPTVLIVLVRVVWKSKIQHDHCRRSLISALMFDWSFTSISIRLQIASVISLIHLISEILFVPQTHHSEPLLNYPFSSFLYS